MSDQTGDKPDVQTRLHRQHQRIAALERDLARVGPQVAALEVRVESLRERVEQPDWTADDSERAQARRLVDEIRREHEQVRARISSAVRYEERLRQLEEQVSAHLGEDA